MLVIFTVLIKENVSSNHSVSAISILREGYLTSYLTDPGVVVRMMCKCLLF